MMFNYFPPNSRSSLPNNITYFEHKCSLKMVQYSPETNGYKLSKPTIRDKGHVGSHPENNSCRPTYHLNGNCSRMDLAISREEYMR